MAILCPVLNAWDIRHIICIGDIMFIAPACVGQYMGAGLRAMPHKFK